jgi:hypothetical protein
MKKDGQIVIKKDVLARITQESQQEGIPGGFPGGFPGGGQIPQQ